MKNGGSTLRRVFVGSVMLLVLSMVASAAPLACDAVTQLSELILFGCIHQDKLFSSFTYTTGAGGVTFDHVLAHHEFTGSGPGGGFGPNDIHGWSFTPDAAFGSWMVGFNLQYNIEIVAGFPTQRIYLVKDQQNSGAVPNTTSVTDIETVLAGDPPCCATYTLKTNGSTPAETLQSAFVPRATKIHTNSTFDPGGGAGAQLASWEQQWFEQSVPEPGTFLLMGLGLLGATGIARRTLRKQ